MTFGERLRELRKQSGLSQRDLAERVDIDFTYLSKIENQRVAPPSEAVIGKLAHELANTLRLGETELADELILLAGKIPSDIARIISQDRATALRYLRSLNAEVHMASDWAEAVREETKGDRD